MFRNWGFLLGEIWILILLALLLGLLAGWLIFGGRRNDGQLEVLGLQRELDACRKTSGEKDAELSQWRTSAANRNDALEACEAKGKEKDAEIARLKSELDAKPAAPAPAPFVVPSRAPEPVATDDVDYDGDGIIEGEDEGTRPEALTEARAGGADDLKRIKGIGPKLEKLCNTLGFFHFDQIAAWTSDEIAWVDANLDGFKGRVSRDEWVSQAKLLAAGGETEFSKKVDDGDVY